jgi:DNA-binding transcriptional ArsR family regulator
MDAVAGMTGLRRRALVSKQDAARLGRLFRLLSGGSRVRLLHALAREDEAPVGRLAELSELSVQAASNQLNRLADHGIVAARRSGRHILYRLADPRVEALLEQAWGGMGRGEGP